MARYPYSGSIKQLESVDEATSPREKYKQKTSYEGRHLRRTSLGFEPHSREVPLKCPGPPYSAPRQYVASVEVAALAMIKRC